MTTPKERGRTDRNLNFQVFDVRKEEELLCNCAGRRRERRRWGEVALHVREAGGRRDDERKRICMWPHEKDLWLLKCELFM